MTTVASDSVHGQALALAGGRNVYRERPVNLRIKARISIEQVLFFDPEVIVVQEASFFNDIYRDGRWSGIRAVRNKRVFLEPDTPFNWMDRPPSFLRLLGAKWLAGILYPGRSSEKLMDQTAEFFKLFLGKTLENQEIRILINRDRYPSDQGL